MKPRKANEVKESMSQPVVSKEIREGGLVAFKSRSGFFFGNGTQFCRLTTTTERILTKAISDPSHMEAANAPL